MEKVKFKIEINFLSVEMEEWVFEHEILALPTNDVFDFTLRFDSWQQVVISLSRCSTGLHCYFKMIREVPSSNSTRN